MAIEATKLEAIIEDIYEGSTVRKTLLKHKLGNKVFFESLASIPLLEQRYVRARFAAAEIMADDIIEIADTAEDAQKARNQIDSRKWHAGKTNPNKYGDRIDLNVNQTIDIRGALDTAMGRIREVVDITHQLSESATGLEPVVQQKQAIKSISELLE